MAGNKSYTIVEYFGGDDGYRCGYCKNEKGNFSHGMWSHTMTVQDYQDLIDRGWRRSGKYVYKPIMNKTCCPQYTIRCHALKFQPSKSHKKILKKMSKFISKEELPKGQEDGEPMDSVCEEAGPREPSQVCHAEVKCTDITDIQKEISECPAITEVQKEVAGATSTSSETSRKDAGSLPDGRTAATAPKPGMGVDPNRPPCRKAKDLRKERRLQKEQMRQHADGVSPVVTPTSPTPTATQTNQPKTLEDFIDESLPDNTSHCLEVRLVRSNPPCPQFKASFDASYQVYKLYQMAIHKDPPDKPSESQVRLVPVSFEDPQFTASYQQSAALYARYQMAIHGDDASECSESEFRRFLCDSPLEAEHSPDGPEVGYGSFHQQYWLDGRIVAVGVIDILPTCVSSVYLYYHPDFASLSLGSYSALREISFTRQLQKQSPKLCYYYLGFYIHSCPKMRYKGQYRPSDLLCPETYIWVPIERCIPQLENSRYARLSQDPDAGDARVLTDVGRALVLYRRTVMPYAAYCRKRKGSSDETEVQQYAGLVGQDCAERILLYRA
ncbi:arginyl-tRNA--protein transferase 1 isoform X1 [Thunnus albacares]|uniref:arginyl-tRNA--protein transferase 1 isoform X1 n=1 Tax=Thunnus maccoyii TaxID=8240 RepID=UPI001C4C5B76|nr:arginyl-tRNA--protein transferase 1 isoform X1 [Thunnus maccoyii]XP_044228915.1 arginyl-tRNA--protein transferase 1 isoform X1 [Thunnus albacares]